MATFFADEVVKEKRGSFPTQSNCHNERVSNVFFGNVLEKELYSGAGWLFSELVPHHVH
jgi:hypothetical protein